MIKNEDCDPNDKSLTTAELMSSDLLKEDTAQREECELWVPKFKFKAPLNLKSVLNKMGMEKPFIKGAADFSGIDGSKNLFISNVIHEAFIEVDEQGTKAAAVTAVAGVESNCSPPEIRFDRPFDFHIIDESNEIVIFSGRYEGK